MREKRDPWAEVDEMMSALENDCAKSTQPTALPGHLFKMLKVQCEMAKANDRSARRVVTLTWGLFALTVALLVVAVVQVVMNG